MFVAQFLHIFSPLNPLSKMERRVHTGRGSASPLQQRGEGGLVTGSAIFPLLHVVVGTRYIVSVQGDEVQATNRNITHARLV